MADDLRGALARDARRYQGSRRRHADDLASPTHHRCRTSRGVKRPRTRFHPAAAVESQLCRSRSPSHRGHRAYETDDVTATSRSGVRHAHQARTASRTVAVPKKWVYPGFPTIFRGLSEFFVGDLMGKALWKLVENAQRFPRRGGRVLCVHGPVSFHRARPCATKWPPRRGLRTGPPASSDCGRP